MKRITLFLILTFPFWAFADIDTDKAVGNCMGYLAIQKKEAAMHAALAMADNQNRALNFGNIWIKNAGTKRNDKNALQVMVFSASSDCRKIGIRPADY